ncbi:MAG: hypothetical protein DRH79_05450 [Candidatus Cloacimonadota bacterium]|nr:MAG: hypothetical protein DRH79_05450 [Candidatus Cloacimonadota bacterium]
MDKVENLEDIAVVKETGEYYVLVEMMRTGACDTCAMNGLCHGHDKTVTHKIITDNEYTIGDKVKIDISAKLRIASSLFIFLFPVLMMILFYSLSRYLFYLTDGISILISFAGLIISGFTIYLVDKKVGRKLKFEIIELLD